MSSGSSPSTGKNLWKMLKNEAATFADKAEEVLSPSREERIKQTTTGYFEKFDLHDTQELCAHSGTHWILSVDRYTSKIPTEPPCGMARLLPPVLESDCWVLIPENPELTETLDFLEIHQIIRELTVGIYVMNQLPMITLDGKYDSSTSVSLPPTYIDTKVGQVLTNVDYMMKALWHGSYIPREKRIKFTDRWRKKVDVNPATGRVDTAKDYLPIFESEGLQDVTKDEEYRDLYASITPDRTNDPEVIEDQRFFMESLDDIVMKMTVSLKSVSHFRNVFVADSDWLVGSSVRLTEDRLEPEQFEALHSRLRAHQTIIQAALDKKMDVKKELELLKVISFLVPFLITMRKKMKIPDLSKVLAPLFGDAVKTERELPPLMIGSKYKCPHFSFGNTMFHVHGGVQIDLDTPDPEIIDKLDSVHEQLYDMTGSAWQLNTKAMDPSLGPLEAYPIPTVKWDNKKYYAVRIEFDNYYPAQPHQKPAWVKGLITRRQEVEYKCPLKEAQVMEELKRHLGAKKTAKFGKNPLLKLRAAAQRGFVAVFAELARLLGIGQLVKQDDTGLSLIHQAAMYNRPQIIAVLMLNSLDLNTRRTQSITSSGPTALHLAARCGSLDAAACLCANYANVVLYDQRGWAPIHNAAYFNSVPIVKLLVRRHSHLLELDTQNEDSNTPLLLAARSGALDSVKCLISLGANIRRINAHGNNLVHQAALRFHTNVLEYFIMWGNPNVPVWSILIEMLLSSQVQKKDAAVRCLEVLSTSQEENWKAILSSGGVAALVSLLSCPEEELQTLAASVLCNISVHEAVRRALAAADAAPTLIRLLASQSDDIQSHASIILSDIACIGENSSLIAEMGGIPQLIELLDSDFEDVLVNSVNALRVLCNGNTVNQTAVANGGAIASLVEFLTIDSDVLKAAAAYCLAALCLNHKANQLAVLAENAAEPLVQLLGNINVTVQVKAASAIECMSDDNPTCQAVFLQKDAPLHLTKLLKIFTQMVKEQGACALWALAGETKPQQRKIAERIGISEIISMILSEDSEKLQYVACMSTMALCRENQTLQNCICDESGIQPLVRLLRSAKTSEHVLLSAIKTVGVLCLGVAHCNNKKTQNVMAEKGAIPVLVKHLLKPPSIEIQVETACSLGCLVLGNVDNQTLLKAIPAFNYSIILELLTTRSASIRLRAGTALAIFAFNNTPQQYAVREAGGIKYSVFQTFLDSANDFYKAYAAFQIVILARVIVDREQVFLTATGVTQLVELLKSTDDNVVILAASLLSSLAHTRAGIPDAMTTSGAIRVLIPRLDSPFDLVRNGCAVALGYLSYNKTAARLLFSECRQKPKLYEKMRESLGADGKISREFVQDFEHAKLVGLPSITAQSPMRAKTANPRAKTSMHFYGSSDRPKTSTTAHRQMRAVSAPAKSHRYRLRSTATEL